MTSVDRDIRLRPATVEDLELMLAWRSNPEIYRHFREQDEPLTWSEHLSWFASRPEERKDHIIEYNGRRVGAVSIDPDNNLGIYIGEVGAQGNGIGRYAIGKMCERYSDRGPLFAEIEESNKASQALFESIGFDEIGQDGRWKQYRYDG